MTPFLCNSHDKKVMFSICFYTVCKLVLMLSKYTKKNCDQTYENMISMVPQKDLTYCKVSMTWTKIGVICVIR